PVSVPALKLDIPAEPIPSDPTPLSALDDGPQTLRVFHISDGDTLDDELALKLKAAGYESYPSTDISKLKELLARVPPTLIILGRKAQSAIEEIGALVLAARARSGRHITLVALSTDSDLSTRLRA